MVAFGAQCLAFAALVLVAGCAHAPMSSERGLAALPGTTMSLRAIDYFRSPKEVGRPYREVGLVSVLSYGRDTDEMVLELKEKARELGAEALVALARDDTSGTGLNYGQGACEPEAIYIRAIAIVYDEDAGER